MSHVEDLARWPIVTTLCANLMSVVACAWLIRHLRRIGRRRATTKRRELFARQLWHLALADIAVSLSSVAYIWMQQGRLLLRVEQHLALACCRGGIILAMASLNVARFVEMCIIVGFTCIYWRRLRMVLFLHRVLPFVWPFGMLLAGVEVLPVLGYSADSGTCELHTPMSMFVHIGAAILWLCFFIAFVANLATVYHVLRYPGSVQALVWRIAWVYPASFFASSCLSLVYFMFWPAFASYHVFYAVALALEGLNGFVNVLAYSFGSRKMRSGIASLESVRSPINLSTIGPSIPGSWGDSALSSHQRRELDRDDLLDFLSFHVGFEANIATEIFVSDVHSEACRQIDQDLGQLQAERDLLANGGSCASAASADSLAT